jgi:hypothetical protein
MFRLYREIKSLNVRIKVMMDQKENQPSSEGDSGDLSQFITKEVKSLTEKRTDAEKRLKHERKQCQQYVNGNGVMEKVFQMLNRDIFK